MDRTLRRRAVLAGAATLLGAGTLRYAPLKNSTPMHHDHSPAVTPEQVAAARDGLVVPVANGLDSDAAIDPTRTATPVSDAVARIDAAGPRRGFGAVFLPPGEISQAEPVRPTQYTRFVGWGINTSVVSFTDPEGDGFLVTGFKEGRFVSLDGFTISGATQDRRRQGSAIRFINDGNNPRAFNIGALAFRGWVDPVISAERGSPYGCRWQYLDFGFDANAGRELALGRNQSLLGTQIGQITAGNSTGNAVVTTDFSGAWLRIGTLNIGGSAGQALRLQTTWNGHIRVENINFESGVTTDNPVISLRGPASTHIGYVRNNDGTVGSVVELGTRNGHNLVGRVRNTGQVRRGLVELTGDSVGPSWYFGDSADITVSTDAPADRVWALGDMRSARGQPPGVVSPPGPSETNAALAPGEFRIDDPPDDPPRLVYRGEDGRRYGRELNDLG